MRGSTISHLKHTLGACTCWKPWVGTMPGTTINYPERILVAQIYRTCENRAFCKNHQIRILGPKLERPCANQQRKEEKKQEYQDNTDRIENEREFNVEKHSYGLGLITTKLEETLLSSIALSIFVANLFKMQRRILCVLLEKRGISPLLRNFLVIKPA